MSEDLLKCASKIKTKFFESDKRMIDPRMDRLPAERDKNNVPTKSKKGAVRNRCFDFAGTENRKGIF